VTAAGSVRVSLPLELDRGLDPTRLALLRHLEIGGFAEAVSKVDAWKDACSEYLAHCYRLLDRVRAALKKQGVEIPETAEARAGFAAGFPLALCVAVVEGRCEGRSAEYWFQQHSDRLFGLCWCDIDIAFAETTGELDEYESQHRQLRGQFGGSRVARQIADGARRLQSLQLEIAAELDRFVATVPLPGNCDLCQPAKPFADDDQAFQAMMGHQPPAIEPQ